MSTRATAEQRFVPEHGVGIGALSGAATPDRVDAVPGNRA